MAMNFSITCNETWVSSVNIKTKRQSQLWIHTHSPNKPKSLTKHVCRKLKVTVFWDRKGVLADGGIHATRYHNVRSVLQNTKKKTAYGHSE
jgi:hypothetical protein